MIQLWASLIKSKIHISFNKPGSNREVNGDSFLPDWFKVYPWLVLCITTLKVFATSSKFCTRRVLLSDNYVNSVFVSMGFDNWKKVHERF